MTVLQGSSTVLKCDKRIILRGEIDYTFAVCVRACAVLRERGAAAAEKLAEILSCLKEITRCEALGITSSLCGVFGYSEEQLREVSNFPEKYLGQGHFIPDENECVVISELNLLRVQIRRCEVAAAALYAENGEKWTLSIVKSLNRLSAAVYILMLKAKKTEKF